MSDTEINRLQCPHCKKRLRVGANAVGKRVRCPHCTTMLDVPASSGFEAIQFQCRCGEELKGKYSPTGESVRCPSCRHLFIPAKGKAASAIGPAGVLRFNGIYSWIDDPERVYREDEYLVFLKDGRVGYTLDDGSDSLEKLFRSLRTTRAGIWGTYQLQGSTITFTVTDKDQREIKSLPPREFKGWVLADKLKLQVHRQSTDFTVEKFYDFTPVRRNFNPFSWLLGSRPLLRLRLRWLERLHFKALNREMTCVLCGVNGLTDFKNNKRFLCPSCGAGYCIPCLINLGQRGLGGGVCPACDERLNDCGGKSTALAQEIDRLKRNLGLD